MPFVRPGSPPKILSLSEKGPPPELPAGSVCAVTGLGQPSGGRRIATWMLLGDVFRLRAGVSEAPWQGSRIFGFRVFGFRA